MQAMPIEEASRRKLVACFSAISTAHAIKFGLYESDVVNMWLKFDSIDFRMLRASFVSFRSDTSDKIDL